MNLQGFLILIGPITLGALDVLEDSSLLPVRHVGTCRVEDEVAFLTLNPRLPTVHMVRTRSDSSALQLASIGWWTAGARRRHVWRQQERVCNIRYEFVLVL